MTFFLLTYSRGSKISPRIDPFEDAEEAMTAFAAEEKRHREAGGGERVVLLLADDEEALRTTHSHYFSNVNELLAQVAY